MTMKITIDMLSKEGTPCAAGLEWFKKEPNQELCALAKSAIKQGKEPMEYVGWGLCAVMTKKQRIEWGIFAAYQVSHLWKKESPVNYAIWDKWASGKDRSDAARSAARAAAMAAARAAAMAAAWDAAWAAAMAAAWDAEWDASRDAARDAAWDAARDAARAAAKDAAWDAARVASRDAARDAARAAAWDDAWDAARDAARDAAWDAAMAAEYNKVLAKIIRYGIKLLLK